MHLLKEAMLYETLKKKKKAKNCFEINQDIKWVSREFRNLIPWNVGI